MALPQRVEEGTEGVGGGRLGGEAMGPITLIRPPVVKRENLSVRGSRGVPACERPGGRARETGADLISRAVSDTGVCTKHLLRLDRAAEHVWVTRAEGLRPPRPRNSSVPSCRPTQCERAPADGRSQLTRGSGEGQPTALGRTSGQEESSRHGVQSTQGTSGPSQAEMHARGWGRTGVWCIGSGSVPSGSS